MPVGTDHPRLSPLPILDALANYRGTLTDLDRSLVGLEIDGAPLGSFNDGSMIEPFPVRGDGGAVTSACWSPRLERNIGLAMVPIADTPLGTELVLETPDGPRDARVVEKPFLDARKHTPKG